MCTISILTFTHIYSHIPKPKSTDPKITPTPPTTNPSITCKIWRSALVQSACIKCLMINFIHPVRNWTGRARMSFCKDVLQVHLLLPTLEYNIIFHLQDQTQWNTGRLNEWHLMSTPFHSFSRMDRYLMYFLCVCRSCDNSIWIPSWFYLTYSKFNTLSYLVKLPWLNFWHLNILFPEWNISRVYTNFNFFT